MKKIILSLSAFALIQAAVYAQAPAGFNYQGIARNASGAPLASKTLGLRITVRDGSASGTPVYQETQTPSTNAYGLYNITIGGGTAVTGTFAGINWASGSKYIQVEMDPAGGTAYTDLGASQLQSVPYALNAASAPAPTLMLSGNTLTAGGNTVTLPAAPVYTAGTGISVSGSNVISAANLVGDVTDAPNANTVAKIQSVSVAATAPTNGQVLKYNGTAWAPAADNDAQTLSISGNTLSVSNGNSVTLPAAAAYSGGTGITVSGSTISANNLAGDVTGAPNANTVAKIQNVSVAATAPTSGQVLRYNPVTTAWTPATDTGYRGNATTGYIPVVTAVNTLGNSLLYQNGTRVGIGTTTLGGTLDVHGTASGLLYSIFKNDNTGSNSRQEVQAAANNLSVALGASNGPSSVSSSGPYTYIKYGSGVGSRFSVTNNNDDEQLTVAQNGNVGINKLAPTGLFHIYQNNRTNISANGFKNGMVMEYGQTQWSMGVGSNDGYSIGSYNSVTGYISRHYIDAQKGYTSIGYGTSPASTLDVSGSVSMANTYVNTTNAPSSFGYNYSATDSDYVLIVAPPVSITINITLPLPSAAVNRIYVIRKANGAQGTINVRILGGTNNYIYTSFTSGNPTNFLLPGTSNKSCVTLQSDGVNWYSIGEF